MFRFAILSFILIQTSNIFGYNIQFDITGGQNSKLVLAYYYGDRKFIKDSTLLDENGKGAIQAEEKLPGGLYIVLFSNNKHIEVLINEDDEFIISTDTSDVIEKLAINGALESELFLKYQREMIHRQKLGAVLKQALNNITPDNPRRDDVVSKIKKLDAETKISWKTLSQKYPETFTAMFLKALMPPEIPDFDVINTNHPDSSKFYLAYKYLVAHFFDNIDLSDERFLRSPLLPEKLDTYFNHMLIQDPVNIIPAMNSLLEKPGMNKNIYQFILSYLFNEYNEISKINYDDVLIEIAEKYYFTGKAYWASDDLLKQLKEKIAKLKPTQLGNTAPEITMETETGEFLSLHKINAKYTILYFWEPDCGHCTVETPKLKTLYDGYKELEINVFAVNTQTNKEKWTEYINQNNLDWINVYDPYNASDFREKYNIFYSPKILLLDDNKTIVAKNTSVRFIEKKLKEFLRQDQ